MFSISKISVYTLQILFIISAWIIFYIVWTRPEIQLIAPLLFYSLAPLRKLSVSLTRNWMIVLAALDSLGLQKLWEIRGALERGRLREGL